MATTTNNEKPQGYEHADLVDEKQKHHVGNQMLGDVEQTLINDPEYRAKEKQLVRRLDMTLMPMVWFLYMFNYLDRNNIAQARLNTFEEDLGLVGNQFNVAVSILNVGYMLMQLPSNMIITRVRPSIYLPCCAAVWSCISAATAGTHNFSGLIAIRFFLGIVEAPFFPGAFHIMSSWYTRKELALRTAILYSGLILATAFSGLIAAGIFHGLDGVRGLAGWKWLFILEGVGSFVAAMVALLILPDYPESKQSWWAMSEDLRKFAHERVLRDRVSEPEGERSVWIGVKEAAMDYRTWVFVLLLCANHTAYGFNNFFPTIMRGFNLGSTETTLLLTAPPYLVAAVVSFAVAYSSDRLKERGLHISGLMAVAMVGFIISVATLSVPARYFASFLFTSGCFSANGIVFSWFAVTLNQTPEKRAAATAMINLLSQFGNIWSPYFFPKSDGPRYLMAMLLMLAFSVLSIACSIVMRVILMRANKRLRDEAEREGKPLVPYTL